MQSELFRNSSRLLSANVVAQVIGILIYPLLTRLYSEADFGLMNLFVSIGGVLGVLATGEYQYAIVLEKEDRRARAIMSLCTRLLILTALVVAMSVLLRRPIAEVLGAPELIPVYVLMPIYVIAIGAWNILNYRYSREKDFKRISYFQYAQSILASIFKVAYGFMHMAGGLVYATVIGPLLGVIVTLKRVQSAKCKVQGAECKDQSAERKVQSEEVREVAREYRKFPMYSLPRAVVNNLSGNLPALVLTPFFGLSELGYFAMAMTLAFRPLNMISTSLYQTFFQRTAEAVNQRRSIAPFFRKFIGRALMVAAPCMVLLYVILPWLTEWLLGAGWEQTGELIRVMLPWLLMSVLVAPICFLSDVFGKQKLGLVFEVVFLLVRLMGLAVGIYVGSFYGAIIGYATGGALVIGAQLIWLMSLVRQYEREIACV